MTQELIANMLGVRREGVTEAAGASKTYPKEIIMSSQDKFSAQRPDLESMSLAQQITNHEVRQPLGNPPDCVPVAPTVEVNLVRRQLLIGSAVVGLGGV